MKVKILILIAFCFALRCQRNINDPNNIVATSWEAFVASGTRDTPQYPDIGFGSEPPICENIDGSYIIADRLFHISFFEYVTNRNQKNKRYNFVIMTKSGDIEHAVVPYHNALGFIAHFYSEAIMMKSGTPYVNNSILETSISNDSLAVRVRLDDGANLIKVGPIIHNCPE